MLHTKSTSPLVTGSSTGKAPGQPRPVVLVVDDHTDFRRTLCQFIELQGHRVLEASTGDEALDVLTDDHVGVIVTDISMPGLNGVDLIRQIRKRSQPEPRIIVMTGHEVLNSEISRVLTSLGVTAILRKPFQLTELIEAMDAA